MIKQISAVLLLIGFLISGAYAQADWGIGTYDTYDPGYFDDTSSDLYDVSDDWYYDNYTMSAQEEEEFVDDDSYVYDWEADTELFDEGL